MVFVALFAFSLDKPQMGPWPRTRASPPSASQTPNCSMFPGGTIRRRDIASRGLSCPLHTLYRLRCSSTPSRTHHCTGSGSGSGQVRTLSTEWWMPSAGFVESERLLLPRICSSIPEAWWPSDTLKL